MAPQNLSLSMDNYFYENNALIIVEYNNFRQGVTYLFYNSLTAGHPRISKTTNLITPHYWWPHMHDFITAYVKGCATCQSNKVNTHSTNHPCTQSP